jgi:hypothetical protein
VLPCCAVPMLALLPPFGATAKLNYAYTDYVDPEVSGERLTRRGRDGARKEPSKGLVERWWSGCSSPASLRGQARAREPLRAWPAKSLKAMNSLPKASRL